MVSPVSPRDENEAKKNTRKPRNCNALTLLDPLLFAISYEWMRIPIGMDEKYHSHG
jgi:hypothetical protein